MILVDETGSTKKSLVICILRDDNLSLQSHIYNTLKKYLNNFKQFFLCQMTFICRTINETKIYTVYINPPYIYHDSTIQI